MKKPPDTPRSTIRVRTLLAEELHKLITDMCFRAKTWDAAEECYLKLEHFLKTKGKEHPEIMLEPSINKCSHFIDILHLPFVDDVECEQTLRIAKSKAMFDLLTRFCREEAQRNEDCNKDECSTLSWHAYAHLMIHPNNTQFTPLFEAVCNCSDEMTEHVINELQKLRHKKLITDE